MANRIVTGTWQAHPHRGTELTIDVQPPATNGPVRNTDTGWVGAEPVRGLEGSPVFGQAILVTVRSSDGTTGEYRGTVHHMGQPGHRSIDPASSVSPTTRFRYKRFSL